MFLSLLNIRMEKQVLIFQVFHKNKRPISIDRVETRIIVLSKKDLYGKKMFI